MEDFNGFPSQILRYCSYLSLPSELLLLQKYLTREKMKKLILLSFTALALLSCNKETNTAEKMKTAYVDTAKLLEENNEAKDIEEKYKVKSQEMGREFEGEVAKFRQDAAAFRQNMQLKGQAWAQEKGLELQKREQELSMKKQSIYETLQQQSGKEMDSLVKKMKALIKEHGKKNGYDYIYGTGDAATVLYAKEAYDITAVISKEINDSYKGSAKQEEEPKADEKK